MDAVNILFCKTDLPLSTVIMWGLEEPVSHVAIDLPATDWVVHSDLMGVHKVYRDAFMRGHTIVETFKINGSAAQLGAIQGKFLSYIDADTGAEYDFGAFTYFCLAAAAHKYIGTAMPVTNPWGSDQDFLCTEVSYLLNEAIVEVSAKTLFPYSTDLGATSPWDLRNLLIKCAGGKSELDLYNVSNSGGPAA